MDYISRLAWLKLPTLKYRRFRGDMLELYKILNNLYDSKTVPVFEMHLDILVAILLKLKLTDVITMSENFPFVAEW